MVEGLFDDGWLGVVNASRSSEGLDGAGDDLDGFDDLELLELLDLEGAERVKEPPPLRPALLFA